MRINILLLIFSTVLSLILLEIGIRAFDAARGIGFFTSPRNQITRQRELLPFRTFGPNINQVIDGKQFISSRHGELFPLAKPADSFRIVVFGGSTTENIVTYRETGVHYPLLIEEKLQAELENKNIEVINVANSGYSTVHSLILFELDVVAWDPDLIIVSHNINDLHVQYWPDFALDYSNKYGNNPYVPDFDSLYTLSNIIFQHSELYWFVKATIRENITQPPVQRESFGEEPSGVALDIFKRNLETIITLAKAENIQVLLGNQPLEESEAYFLEHMAHKIYNDVVIYPLHNEFVQHHKAFNLAVEEVAYDNDVYFLDNASFLNGEIQYFIDFVHYTPEGVEKVAENYANFLIAQEIIP